MENNQQIENKSLVEKSGQGVDQAPSSPSLRPSFPSQDGEGKKVDKRILKSIRGVILYILIVAALAYLTPKLLGAWLQSEYPLAAITSNSMWPVLKKGDLVFVQGVAPEAIAVGDIVVYAAEKGTFMIHRVVELKEKGLVTKGDANLVADPPVKYEKIVGRLLKIKGWPVRIPKLGFVSIMVGNP